METFDRERPLEDINLNLGELTVGHDVDTGRLAASFFSEDDIGVVIRCHFEVERAATHSLEALTGGRWRKVRGKYLSDQLNLLEVLGAPPKLLAPARTLNNQRNDFAHDGVSELSEQQLLDLLRGVRAFLPQLHDDFEVRIRGKREFKATFRECSIRQKYALTAGMLALLVGGLPETIKAYNDEMRRRAKAPQST